MNKPKLGVALAPVVFLIILLVINVMIFKDDATSGPNQIALLLAAFFSAFLGVKKLGAKYKDLEEISIKSIIHAMQACLILFVVGSVIGAWIVSGVVPTMIFYGIKLIHPGLFLPLACLVCAIVSTATGSSWSTGGTVGIALIGIGKALGFPIEMVAGAVISGSYFGDKMSPLSDTTNMAPAIAGAELFEHIKHMVYTTAPAFVTAFLGFAVLGFFQSSNGSDISQVNILLETITSNFNINIILLSVPVLVVVLVAKKFPPIPAMMVGAALGIVFALLFQSELLMKMSGGSKEFSAYYKVLMNTLVNGFSIETGNPVIDSLFSRGGMKGMLTTVWLIMLALFFGGMMEATGMLNVIALSIVRFVKGTGSLVASTIGTSVFLNLTVSDQYLAIVVTARMFKETYAEYGLKPKNLSRAVEDGATVTSVLVPWNSGGAYFSSILGVPTLSYLPYCFFNILSPISSIIVASTGYTMEKIGEGDEE